MGARFVDFIYIFFLKTSHENEIIWSSFSIGYLKTGGGEEGSSEPPIVPPLDRSLDLVIPLLGHCLYSTISNQVMTN